MAIKGSLKEASLPDVLQLLAMGQKTGCLSVTDRANFGYIYFDRGRITYAAIVNRRDRLGDLLVKNGLLDPAELSAAVDTQAVHPEKRLGEILIERSSITRDQLEQYIRIQIEEAVYFLFTWNQGSFYFEADQRPEEGAMLVSINPENLLLEGARRIDEWSLIEKKIPSLDLIFDLERSREIPPDLELTDEQRKIVPLLDGTRSVQELIEESGLVEFEVGKAVFGLIQAGFAHPVGRQRATEEREVPAGRIDEHRNLGVAFYKTAMFEEATREFKRVAELQPQNMEAKFFLALIGLRRGDAKFAIRYLKEMVESGGPKASAFHNLGLALEQLGRLGDARVVMEEALRLAPKNPSIVLSRAIVLLKEGHVAESRTAFDEYRELLGSGRPSAAYFAFSVLAAAAAGDSPAALDLGKEGVALHPHSSTLLLHLGAVHERRGDWDQAEVHYRRAAEEGPELPQAHKALADALYRRGAYDEASEAYGRAIKLAPELGDDVYFKLGNIHYKQMEREKAVKLWHRALELNPRNKVVRTNLELVEGALAGPGAVPGPR
jgi:tetratricopeptide (TPR) repeat protein